MDASKLKLMLIGIVAIIVLQPVERYLIEIAEEYDTEQAQLQPFAIDSFVQPMKTCIIDFTYSNADIEIANFHWCRMRDSKKGVLNITFTGIEDTLLIVQDQDTLLYHNFNIK